MIIASVLFALMLLACLGAQPVSLCSSSSLSFPVAVTACQVPGVSA